MLKQHGTLESVDSEVRAVIANCYNTAVKILTENREALDKIAEFLIEKETITGKEFMEIFNKVKAAGQEEASEEVTEETSEEITE